MIDVGEHENDQKKNGRPFTYNGIAIETLQTTSELFRLPYRPTEGFGRALAKLMGADVAIPDYTSLAKRHGNSIDEPRECDECLRQIRRDGKKAWKEPIGYHCRCLAGTAMFRLTQGFGDRPKNWKLADQANEVALRASSLTPSSPSAYPSSHGVSRQGRVPHPVGASNRSSPK